MAGSSSSGVPHAISLIKAKAMTLRYRQNRENILATAYQGQNILLLSETFDKASLVSLVTNVNCLSIRIYYGMDEDLRVHAIFVGVNSGGEDILPALANEEDENGEILEDGIQCPPLCPPLSPLNEP